MRVVLVGRHGLLHRKAYLTVADAWGKEGGEQLRKGQCVCLLQEGGMTVSLPTSCMTHEPVRITVYLVEWRQCSHYWM